LAVLIKNLSNSIREVAFEVNIMKQGEMTENLMQENFQRGPTLLGANAAGLAQLAPGHVMTACAPLNQVDGIGAYQERLLRPLARAFPLGQERMDMRLAGNWKGGDWVASSGHIIGLFAQDLFGIPATNQTAFVRFGRFERYENGLIVETLLLLDLPSLMMQAGVWPIGPSAAPSGGPSYLAPSPATHDGVVVKDIGGGVESLALVEAMIGGLHKFDGKGLKSMGMTGYWSADFGWYGPAPIGNFCGHADYERGHQLPFLTAFPDRVGGNHRARIGEGAYVASTGWPSITATHSGDGWLGLTASGKPITMRVADFWRAENGQLVENWVMIDIPDLLAQMGHDVFAHLSQNPASK
jgi:SnoaL-like polyketide cyclase